MFCWEINMQKCRKRDIFPEEHKGANPGEIPDHQNFCVKHEYKLTNL